MAVKKISELNVMVAPANEDLLAIVDTSEIDTKKITYANLTKEVKDSVDLVEADIIALDTRLDTAEADIVVLDSRLDNGWNLLTGTFTYASADAPTFVMNTPSDLTGVIGLGMRIKLTQTTVKYFIVTAITSTTITLYGGTDYTLVNETISNVSYSMVKTPFGFPTSPEKWSVLVTNDSQQQQTNPTAGQWYDTGLDLVVPIGAWKIKFKSNIVGIRTTAGFANPYATLSTTTNSATYPEMINGGENGAITAINMPFDNTHDLVVTSKTTLNVLMRVVSVGHTLVALNTSSNAGSRTVLQATCAYL